MINSAKADEGYGLLQDMTPPVTNKLRVGVTLSRKGRGENY
jgi:hypothetical protein